MSQQPEQEAFGEDNNTCWFADRVALETTIGHAIPDDVYNFVPWGRRLVVVREEAAKVTPGGIIIPDTALPQYTRGWVVSAGQDVGSLPSPHANCPPIGAASLVGRKVMFGNFAGTALVPDSKFGDSRTAGMYVILTDGDLFGELVDAHAQQEENSNDE